MHDWPLSASWLQPQRPYNAVVQHQDLKRPKLSWVHFRKLGGGVYIRGGFEGHIEGHKWDSTYKSYNHVTQSKKELY